MKKLDHDDIFIIIVIPVIAVGMYWVYRFCCAAVG